MKCVLKEQKPIDFCEVNCDESGHIVNLSKVLKWIRDNYGALYERHNIWRNNAGGLAFRVVTKNIKVAGESKIVFLANGDILMNDGASLCPTHLNSHNFFDKYRLEG